ncbi:outer membrane protein assembly factor BamB family protein [Thalassoroseus pseudoceratinae]|uniref:outer membrane protein assembly factor BamB family protein n=1 Tax=Thalassoroseus pseudoceratinae TaxID=2713176 RepID=UPI00141FA9CA|nr:PQQ-binding-like beta-propeller repeat protein [Thalassoroseus pseudoceratinae]
MSPLFSRLTLLVLMCTIANSASAENWSRFRGDNGTGVVSLAGAPVTWSPGDYEWNVELPGVGHSSPIIWGDKLFVTSAIDEGTVRYLFCLDAITGEQEWSRMFALNRSHKHEKSSWASSTPTTDGKHVYVAFADEETYTLTAYDFSGELVWRRRLGAFTSQHGQGVSPIIYKDLVILPNDQMGPSSIVALDKKTGRTVWSTVRDYRRTSYATPMILERDGEPAQLICVSGATGVSSLDPNTGHKNWETGEFPMRTVASPVYCDGLIFASCGGGGKGALMIAVDPSLTKDSFKDGADRIRYQRERILPYVPTPIAHGDHVYLWNDNGVVSCIEAEDGKNIWTQRVGGNYSGSPICIDGKLYAMSESGTVHIVKASPEFEKLGEVELGDPSHATVAVSGDQIYFRTFHRLMTLKVSSKSETDAAR